jgi:hypothetical protein
MVCLDSIDDNVLMGQGGDDVLIVTEGKSLSLLASRLGNVRLVQVRLG